MKALLAITFGIALVASAASADPRWRGGHWHGGYVRSYDPGSAFWGGAIGGFFGSIFAPRPEPPVIVQPAPIIVQPAVPEIVPGTPGWYAYCANKYRSFDPGTGTYLGYDGVRHGCQ